jgi:NADPH:quinone reductase-like Zn-dependent oxidoreductase
MDTLPPLQNAWTFKNRGLPEEVLSLVQDHPVPRPSNGELLIRISYVALNPGCYITMTTIPPIVRQILSLSLSAVTALAEGEFSGIVCSKGTNTPSWFTPGTRVFGSLPMLEHFSGKGVLAEYISVPARHVAVVPECMDMVDAAGLSGAGLTAWNMFLEISIKPGDRLLVNGASGGVGIMVVQLAKAKGAFVVATCSERSRELVLRFGASEVFYPNFRRSSSSLNHFQVVDYRAHAPLHEYLAKAYNERPFAHILDTIGTQSLFEASPAYLAPEGKLINVGNFEGPTLTVLRSIRNAYLPVFLGGVPRTYKMISTTPSGMKAAVLAKMVEEGTLRVVVDEIIEFKDVLRVSQFSGFFLRSSRHPGLRKSGSAQCPWEDYREGEWGWCTPVNDSVKLSMIFIPHISI